MPSDDANATELGSVTFASGSARIGGDQRGSVTAIAAEVSRLAAENPEARFTVEGFADATGSSAVNMRLSERRAKALAGAVADAANLPESRLTVVGMGEQNLKIDTGQPERENRRATVRIDAGS